MLNELSSLYHSQRLRDWKMCQWRATEVLKTWGEVGDQRKDLCSAVTFKLDNKTISTMVEIDNPVEWLFVCLF